MAFDYSKLNGKIVEVYGTQYNFAEAMELSERSISLQLNGKRNWKHKEIVKACELLHIEIQQMPAYFFTEKVQQFEQRHERRNAT